MGLRKETDPETREYREICREGNSHRLLRYARNYPYRLFTKRTNNKRQLLCVPWAHTCIRRKCPCSIYFKARKNVPPGKKIIVERDHRQNKRLLLKTFWKLTFWAAWISWRNDVQIKSWPMRKHKTVQPEILWHHQTL